MTVLATVVGHRSLTITDSMVSVIYFFAMSCVCVCVWKIVQYVAGMHHGHG